MNAALTSSTENMLQNVLKRLSGVVPIGNGYKAQCPGHDDKNPSLVIKVGYRGILLKDWAGCTLSEICTAIGMRESDLFFDAPQGRSYKANRVIPEMVNFNWRWPWRKQVAELLTLSELQAALAQDFLEEVKRIDPSTLTDSQRDILLDQIFLAWAWLEAADSSGDLCFAIAQTMRKEERNG